MDMDEVSLMSKEKKHGDYLPLYCRRLYSTIIIALNTDGVTGALLTLDETGDILVDVVTGSSED